MIFVNSVFHLTIILAIIMYLPDTVLSAFMNSDSWNKNFSALSLNSPVTVHNSLVVLFAKTIFLWSFCVQRTDCYLRF